MPLRPSIRFVGTPADPSDGKDTPAVVTWRCPDHHAPAQGSVLYPFDNTRRQTTEGQRAHVSVFRPFHSLEIRRG